MLVALGVATPTTRSTSRSRKSTRCCDVLKGPMGRTFSGHRASAALAGVILSAFASPAIASTWSDLPFPELVQRSELIVVGEVTDPGDLNRCTVRVVDTLKGVDLDKADRRRWLQRQAGPESVAAQRGTLPSLPAKAGRCAARVRQFERRGRRGL